MTVKKIPTEDIEIGMYVSRLDRPWRETPFLSHGFYVKNTDELEKLIESSRFAYVMVPDEEYTLQSAHNKPISLATIDALIGASRLESLKPRTSFKDELPSAEKAHAGMEDVTMKIWSDLRNGITLNMDDISDRVCSMIDSIERNPDAYIWICCVKDYQSLTYRRAVNVSGLLTVFGRQLELERKDLQLLAIGGLCLDVGNIKLSEDLLNKRTRLTDDEWETMKTHARHSMQLIKQLSDADEKLLWMVATHHERYDGSGYLSGLSGDHIPLFGQMAGIVDSYLASIEPKPYATAMTSDDSIETLFRQRGHHFKSVLVDQFIRAIGLYPTGSLVELSSGEIAVVLAQNMKKRLSPRVALILDAHKRPCEEHPLVNLATQKHTSDGKPLRIVKGLCAGQYPIPSASLLSSLADHLDVEELRTDDNSSAQREQHQQDVSVNVEQSWRPHRQDVSANVEQSWRSHQQDVSADVERSGRRHISEKDSAQADTPTITAEPTKRSRLFGAAAAIAAVVMGGAFILYQQSQLAHLTKQLEESRQIATEKTEEARLLAEAEAKRKAIAEFKAKQAQLVAEAEARQKETEAELQAALRAKRQARLMAEAEVRREEMKAKRKGALEAKRQAQLMAEAEARRKEMEAERKAALEAKRQAQLMAEAEARRKETEAERKAALAAKRQARLMAEAEAPRKETEAERKAALAAKRQAALEVATPGNVFRDRLKDGSEGPEMVVIPAGSFRMGSLQEGGEDDEKPVRTVTFTQPFAMGRYEVTFDEYDRFARASGRKLPDDNGWGRGRNPVINVSWKDAMAYARWLSKQTGQHYRLPTEAEWEYAARAGSESKYNWGNDIETNRANCNGCRSRWDGKQSAPVGSFQPNQFALYDTLGNVWEWVEDCWRPNYDGEPAHISPWVKVGGGNCSRRMRRGGSWGDEPIYVRSANRGRGTPDYRNLNLGFRLARDLG